MKSYLAIATVLSTLGILAAPNALAAFFNLDNINGYIVETGIISEINETGL
ncbi:MAG: hypothetical protein F6K48_34570 [Okeania sp. SIO3H1]|uniref:hypothetical protein n=1 Tax=Okeania sp. SIO1I7 TaxID=2607772 RepID=UPI0013CB7828|nr:hypothetical protein [Okeania sp. SIO1I7]NEN93723.1 hypothetical protein [Okeania sp. SIO3H1]NET29746.1 hypothetical protein [Okeania sp. SIO1I7]